MKWTKTLIQTLRENPGDAEIDSHKLLMRAGLARKVAGGLYAYLPLGMRSLKKIQQIVREEMDRAGALEIVSPILQPAELWRTTGRWDTMGPNMFKLRDRGEHEFALGPTAEEVFTDLAKGLVSSYRQLPVTIYQIQWKFRDETRPRFGLMRSKEFLMKDAYSFDADAEGADKSYWNMYHAYERIYERCGLKAVAVQADGGDMGDSLTHEFHVLADAGEDGIAFCEGCGYAANLEKAERQVGNGERGTGNGERGILNKADRLGPFIDRMKERWRFILTDLRVKKYAGTITDQEYVRTARRYNDYIDFIMKVNTAGFLETEALEKVEEIAAERYVTFDGEEISFISDLEADDLRVRKGTLTTEERKAIEMHAVYTTKILEKITFGEKYDRVRFIAGAHHEYLDGSGYPNKLTSCDLPIEVRILTIMDIFDSLTADDRPYKKAYDKDGALKILSAMVEEGKLDRDLVNLAKEFFEKEPILDQ